MDYVYLIAKSKRQNADIRLGITEDIEATLRTMHMTSPDATLRVLLPGTLALRNAIRRRFIDSRRAETEDWYFPSDELTTYIETCQELAQYGAFAQSAEQLPLNAPEMTTAPTETREIEAPKRRRGKRSNSWEPPDEAIVAEFYPKIGALGILEQGLLRTKRTPAAIRSEAHRQRQSRDSTT